MDVLSARVAAMCDLRREVSDVRRHWYDFEVGKVQLNPHSLPMTLADATCVDCYLLACE